MSSQFPINSLKPSLPAPNIDSFTPPTAPDVRDLQKMIEEVESVKQNSQGNRSPEANFQPSDSALKKAKIVHSPRKPLPLPFFPVPQMAARNLFESEVKAMPSPLQLSPIKNVATSPKKNPSTPQFASPSIVPSTLRSLPLPSPSFGLIAPDFSNNRPTSSNKMPSPFSSLFTPISKSVLKRDWSGARTIKEATPSQPRKPMQGESKSVFKLQYEQLKSGSFEYKGQKYKVSFLGKGNYSAVFSMENSGYVVKCYHGQYRTGFNNSSLKGYLESSLNYYHTLKSLNLSVAEILNADTAAADHCIIQKRIANPINFSDPNQLAQVKAFFDAFCKKGVVMDLQPDNFREENGVVYHIDFLEEEEEPSVRVKTSLKAWANLFYKENVSRTNAEQMLQELGKTFIDSKKYITEDSIQEFLDN